MTMSYQSPSTGAATVMFQNGDSAYSTVVLAAEDLLRRTARPRSTLRVHVSQALTAKPETLNPKHANLIPS